MSRLYWMLLFLGVAMSSFGGLLLKMGAVEIQYNEAMTNIVWQLCRNWRIILGILFYAIPVLIWIYMLKKVELSLLQPLFALVYVVTPVLAMMLLHEQVSLLRWVGIAIIISGVFIFAHG